VKVIVLRSSCRGNCVSSPPPERRWGCEKHLDPKYLHGWGGFYQRINAALMHVHALPNGAVSKNLLQSL